MKEPIGTTVSESAPRGATAEQAALWARISAHDFEPSHQPLSFTRRLGRDRGWTLTETRLAIDGYRRFCFLAMVSTQPVTPSEAVDEVWHQHLTYTRDYWNVWCGEVLGKPLHHDPTPGGQDAQQRYRQLYADTLALHESYFGPPDEKLWPGTHERFSGRARYRTADLATEIIVPRPIKLFRKLTGKDVTA